MANIVIPFAAVSHQPVPSVGFNNNFTEVATKFNTYAVQTDVVKTISVSHNWLTTQTFPGLVLTNDLLFTDASYDIGKTGATRPRDLFLSRNLTVGGILNAGVYAGTDAIGLIFPGAATRVAITANNNRQVANDRIGYYLTFPLGQIAALEGMNENGANNRGSLILRSGTGVGTLQDVLTLDSNKLATFAGAVIIPTLQGTLTMSTAASKLVPGATSFSHRNNADTADNVLITDAGNMTVRLGITAGGGITAPISATGGSFHATPSAADPAISTSDGDIWILTSGAFKAKLNGSVRTLWHSGLVSPGYAAWTGTINRASVFDQSTATLANVAQRLAALQNDLMTAGILST